MAFLQVIHILTFLWGGGGGGGGGIFFQEFKVTAMSAIWNRTILAILNSAPMTSIKFHSIRHVVWDKMLFQEFQDGCHVG